MKKGFTLIELLIVIAIIGILAVALLPAITGGPAKARDTGRVADVQNITTALEAVSIGTGYPAGGGCLTGTTDTAATATTAGAAGTAATAIATEMKSLPAGRDAGLIALCAGNGYYYKKLTDGYLVAVQLENHSNANINQGATGSTDPGFIGSLFAAGTTTAATALTDKAAGSANVTSCADNGPCFYVVIR